MGIRSPFPVSWEWPGRDAWPLLLLLLAVLVPTGLLLWFMSDAITRQAAASQQMALESTRGQLRLLRDRHGFAVADVRRQARARRSGWSQIVGTTDGRTALRATRPQRRIRWRGRARCHRPCGVSAHRRVRSGRRRGSAAARSPWSSARPSLTRHTRHSAGGAPQRLQRADALGAAPVRHGRAATDGAGDTSPNRERPSPVDAVPRGRHAAARTRRVPAHVYPGCLGTDVGESPRHRPLSHTRAAGHARRCAATGRAAGSPVPFVPSRRGRRLSGHDRRCRPFRDGRSHSRHPRRCLGRRGRAWTPADVSLGRICRYRDGGAARRDRGTDVRPAASPRAPEDGSHGGRLARAPRRRWHRCACWSTGCCRTTRSSIRSRRANTSSSSPARTRG